jgi:uncharacterized membrane protein
VSDIDPMLVPFPPACFVGALVTDFAYWRTAEMMWFPLVSSFRRDGDYPLHRRDGMVAGMSSPCGSRVMFNNLTNATARSTGVALVYGTIPALSGCSRDEPDPSG